MTEYNIKVDNGDFCDTRITFQKCSEGGRLGLGFGLKLFIILLTSIYNILIIIIHNTAVLCHVFHSMISEKKFLYSIWYSVYYWRSCVFGYLKSPSPTSRIMQEDCLYSNNKLTGVLGARSYICNLVKWMIFFEKIYSETKIKK